MVLAGVSIGGPFTMYAYGAGITESHCEVPPDEGLGDHLDPMRYL